MSGYSIVAALKLVVALVLIVFAVHYRANRNRTDGLGAWKYIHLPIALGFPLELLLPTAISPPVWFWFPLAWLIGSALVWLADKRGLLDAIPWNDFGPLIFLDGARLRMAWQEAMWIRSDYRKGTAQEMVRQMHAELDAAQRKELVGDGENQVLDTPIVGGGERHEGKRSRFQMRDLAYAVKAAVLSALPGAQFDSKFSRITIGGVPIPRDMEPVHFFLVGTPGSGKTVVLKTMLDAVERDGQRVIAIDSGADLADRYYNPARGDVILNPLDKRCVAWSPFAEIRNIADCVAIATSICPAAEGGDKTWSHAARIFVTAILQRLSQDPLSRDAVEALMPRRVLKVEGEMVEEPDEDYSARVDQVVNHLPPTNGNLMFWAAVAETDILRVLFSGTQAAPYVAEGNERMFGSVRSTAMERLAAYFLLDPNAGPEGFSIRRFVAEGGDAWLFCTYMDDQLNLLKDLIATAIDISAVATLSLSQSSTRRIVFALDEFDSIGKVDSVLMLLAKGRKYGSMVIIGIQTTAQIFKNYGQDAAKSILGLFGTWIINRSPEADTAEYMSRVLGVGNYERRSHGLSHGGGGLSVNVNHQYIQNKPAVSPSEIQNLRVASRLTGTPPEGFLKMGHWMPCRIRLSFPPNREARGGFIPTENINEKRSNVEILKSAAAVAKQSRHGADDIEAKLLDIHKEVESRIILPDSVVKKSTTQAPSASEPQKAKNISAQPKETGASDDALGAATATAAAEVLAAATGDIADPLKALAALEIYTSL